MNELAQQFSELMLRELHKTGIVIPHTLTFIQEQHQQGIEQRIVSGSDQTELRILSQKLRLTSYFQSLRGSPTPKLESEADILKNRSRSASGYCIIGDSQNDYDAARVNGIAFFGFNNEGLTGLGKGYISNFND